MIVGRVVSLTRYPVKSLQGEDVGAADVDKRGLRGDRAWAVYTDDGGIGSGKTTRRFRRVDGLLDHRASLDGGAAPLITTADGGRLRADDPGAGRALGAVLGRAVTLRPEGAVPHHDESPVHLVTTASLRRLAALAGGAVDPRRVRANVLLDVDGDAFVEDAWRGRDLALGESVVLALGDGMPRCVMVDAGPGPRVLRLLGEAHGSALGLQAAVRRTGVVRHGDVARLL